MGIATLKIFIMNHKWVDNKCQKCGIKRERKEFKRWQRSETVLVNGVWQDRTIHTYGTAWHYGIAYKFNRPNCNSEPLSDIKYPSGD